MPLPRLASTGVAYTPFGAMMQEITLLAPATTRDSETGEFEEPSEFATVFAAISPLAGRELEASQQIVSEVTHQIAMNYIAGVTTDMTILFRRTGSPDRDRYFIILAVLDPDESQAELRLMCKERNQGAH